MAKPPKNASPSTNQASHEKPTQDPAPGMVWRHTKNGWKQTKPSVRDTRSPEAIFAQRCEDTRVIIQRQMDKLVALGNARTARPTKVQQEAFELWWAEETDRVMKALFGDLQAQQARGPLLTSPDVTPGYVPKQKA